MKLFDIGVGLIHSALREVAPNMYEEDYLIPGADPRSHPESANSQPEPFFSQWLFPV